MPVVFKAFDLLSLDGASLLAQPLARRRELLESLTLPASWTVVAKHSVATLEELETVFQASRDRANEGLIIKDTASPYTPGRRGMAWLKLKRASATLDTVVIGAEGGHGKRSHLLSDYTFAVRDDASGSLLAIGKAYSGLTDEEIEELTAHFEATTIVSHGRYREVRPEIVLEIAFDSIQESTRHSSGLAMRFPADQSVAARQVARPNRFARLRAHAIERERRERVEFETGVTQRRVGVSRAGKKRLQGLQNARDFYTPTTETTRERR